MGVGQLELWPGEAEGRKGVVQDVAATIALLIGLEMMARGGRPAPGVAVQMAIREYVEGFLPLANMAFCEQEVQRGKSEG